MKDEVELKSCPFCGGRAYFAWFGKDFQPTIYIECEHNEHCGNKINGFLNNRYSIEEQVHRWNTRFEAKKPVTILGKKTNLWKGE